MFEFDGRFCGAIPEKEEGVILVTPGRGALVAAVGGTFSFARSSHPNEDRA